MVDDEHIDGWLDILIRETTGSRRCGSRATDPWLRSNCGGSVSVRRIRGDDLHLTRLIHVKKIDVARIAAGAITVQLGFVHLEELVVRTPRFFGRCPGRQSELVESLLERHPGDDAQRAVAANSRRLTAHSRGVDGRPQAIGGRLPARAHGHARLRGSSGPAGARR